MVITCDVTAVVATTDTTEVSLGTITLPSTAKRILGVGVSIDDMGATTLEGNSGIFRVSINNIDVSPAKFPIFGTVTLTSGAASRENKVWPVDWAPAGNSQITIYVTMDSANTVVVNARGFVLFEK